MLLIRALFIILFLVDVVVFVAAPYWVGIIFLVVHIVVWWLSVVGRTAFLDRLLSELM